MCVQFSSVQFSRSVVSISLRPHEPQHARRPCPSPTPRVYPNPCPLSQWLPSNHLILCHCLLLLPSIFPSIRVFPNESVLHTGGQSIGISASASVLPINIQDWFPLGLTDLISLQSEWLSRAFSNTIVQSNSSLVVSFLYSPTLTSIHNYRKNHSFD